LLFLSGYRRALLGDMRQRTIRAAFSIMPDKSGIAKSGAAMTDRPWLEI
jgi:hypothetical protein